ncbi:MAG: hypothetical protein MUF62_09390 [Chitinophagaceae bacterium]|jgi:hypothetical protein|nr:hypothetical protein [Chitinophagaceae bacterium]
MRPFFSSISGAGLALLIVAMLPGLRGGAQGCSDAGFCTVGAIKAGHAVADTAMQHRVSLLSAIGQGDDGVLVLTNALQYEWQWKPAWLLQARLVSNYASGNLGNTAGLADAIVAISHQRALRGKWNIAYSLGLKLPLQQANASEGGRPLPMQYQPSLGTLDVIAGIALQNDRFHLAAGWQQPLTQRNKNGFLPVYWANNEAAANYPPSNQLRRRADVLLRGSYALLRSGRLRWQAGLLAIYHLGQDRYTDPFATQGLQNIDGSEGLTLNLTSQWQYQISKSWSLGLTAAVPLQVRTVRPDGLTRSWVLAPELSFRF